MTNLNEMNTKELKEMAKELKVKNWWTLKKTELIAAIEAVQTETSESVQDESESAVETACNNVIDETVEESQNEPETTEEELLPMPGADKLAHLKDESEKTQKNNGWELIAMTQLKNAYDQIVGANENAVTDGEMTLDEFHEWIMNSAVDEVYHEAITTKYHEDACGGPAPTEMRFASKEFCYEYLMKLFRRDGYPNASHEPQNGPDLTKEARSDNYKTENEEALKRTVGLKGYAAWVVDRETKEVTSVIDSAESREEFYESIKGKYRVRLITKPEKLEEECKQWEIRHARNKKLKNEKYARDKAEATKIGMTVAEYRKWLRGSVSLSS